MTFIKDKQKNIKELSDQRVSNDQQQTLLKELSGWKIEGIYLAKDFAFANFSQALAKANKVGVLADQNDHHPDLFVGWGKLGVQITTHSSGGLSLKDFVLAYKIDQL